jgi:hypothetical protein
MTIYDEYQRFWKRLSKAEREALTSTGFDPRRPDDSGVPYAHRYFGGEPVSEVWNDNETRTDGYDINRVQALRWAMREREEAVVSEKFFSQDDVLDILRKVIAVIDLSPSAEVKLHGTCIKLALGMPGLPTMTALANQHKLTRAAISARVKTIQRNLKLPPSLYMKSDSACAKLSVARRKKLR